MTPIIDWHVLLLLSRWWSTRPAEQPLMKCLRQRNSKPQDEVSKHHRNTDSQTDTDTSNKTHFGDGDANTKPNRRPGFQSGGRDVFSIMVITCVTPSVLEVRRVHTRQKHSSSSSNSKMSKSADNHRNEAAGRVG